MHRRTVALTLSGAIFAALVALVLWRWTDRQADEAAWSGLASFQPLAPASFALSMLDELPEPAQRFFRFAITPGTPLYTVAEISMEGEFSLGTKAEPNYLPMRAEQLLAAPYGFVWRVHAGEALWFEGSDGALDGTSWSRFWLWGIVPVARAGQTQDHARAAFGRYVAEAVFWCPAALLPGPGVSWQAMDESTARVIVTHNGLEQAVDLTVGEDGQVAKVSFQRWSDANAQKKYQFQTFGGYLSQYREFGGFRLPTHVEAGNFFETDDYFAFFKAKVTSVQFPLSQGN